MKLIIGIAGTEDANAISAVTKAAFGEYVKKIGISTVSALSESIQDIERDIAEKIVLVARNETRVIGCVRLEVFDDGTAYLSRFSVLPELQNTGVGQELLLAADDYMREHFVSKIYLHTASKLASNICFYYKNGFYVEEIEKRDYIRLRMCKEY